MHNRKSERKINVPVLIIGIVCLLAAAGLSIYNVWEIHKSNVAIEEMKDGMEAAMLEAMAERAAAAAAEKAEQEAAPTQEPQETEALPEETEAPAPEETEAPGDVEPVQPTGNTSSGGSSASYSYTPATPAPTPKKTPSPKLDNELNMPTWSWKEFTYIGYISIPSLGINLPVMSTYSSALLAIAPCRYQGSTTNGNLVIAGHNYSNHFGNLYKLRIGDTVTFTDADGTVYNYSVTSSEYIKPGNTATMITGSWDLTIFTCNMYGTSRLTVRCSLS